MADGEGPHDSGSPRTGQPETRRPETRLPETRWVRATRRRQWTTVFQVIGAWVLTLAIGGFIVATVAVLLLSPDITLNDMRKTIFPAPAATKSVATAPQPKAVQWLATADLLAADEDAIAAPQATEASANTQGK